MADVARTRAYSRKNSSSEAAVARRHRRNQMRSSSEAAAEGDSVLPSEEEDLAGEDRSELQEGGAAPFLGIPVAAVPLRRGSGRPPIPGSFRRPVHAPPVVERRSVVPVAGSVAVAGRQRQMEDALTIWMDLCSPQLNRGLPVHYFGVYDGHGGSHVILLIYFLFNFFY